MGPTSLYQTCIPTTRSTSQRMRGVARKGSSRRWLRRAGNLINNSSGTALSKSLWLPGAPARGDTPKSQGRVLTLDIRAIAQKQCLKLLHIPYWYVLQAPHEV